MVDRYRNQNLPDETVMWRYMTWPKFLSLLTDRTLRFSRVDVLQREYDRFEGRFDAARALKAEFADKYDVKENLRKLNENITQTFVLCFREGDDECVAMWDRYTAGSEGVCIKTSVGRLLRSVTHPVPSCIGKIKYIDHDREFFTEEGDPSIHLFDGVLHKRKAFRAEGEIRSAVFKGGADLPESMALAVDLTEFIDSVGVHYRAPKWHARLVTQILAANGLGDVEVFQTDIV